jgi:hypothetical protein
MNSIDIDKFYIIRSLIILMSDIDYKNKVFHVKNENKFREFLKDNNLKIKNQLGKIRNRSKNTSL